MREVKSMNEKVKIFVEYRSQQYLPVKDVVSHYCLSRSSVDRIVKEIEDCPRYKGQWISINEWGGKMINTLIFEDYLHYRTQLKNKNLAKGLPPYSPAKVREQRGEIMVVYADAERMVSGNV